jgi:hypothetical protein
MIRQFTSFHHIVTRGSLQLFRHLVGQLRNRADINEINDVQQVITKFLHDDPVAAARDFPMAFVEVRGKSTNTLRACSYGIIDFAQEVFDTASPQHIDSVSPCFSALTGNVPPSIRVQTLKIVIERLLQHLTVPRPMEFALDALALHAELFAALVHWQLVHISGTFKR